MHLFTTSALAALLVTCASLSAAVQTKVVEYKQAGQSFKGYLAWDDAIKGKRPGVIVVHEWWGNNDYSHSRAEQLAALGYVGFAIDMYGDGKTTTDPKQAGEWSGAVYKDMNNAVERLKLGLDTLKQQPVVDGEKVAAIGYCFGGACVLNMARNNLPVLGVVSFHGSLAGSDPKRTAPIKPKVLVCHGADDTFESSQEISNFKSEMNSSGADWQWCEYGHAVHSFTNPNSGKFGIPGVGYNKQADARSWQTMKDFLDELFK